MAELGTSYSQPKAIRMWLAALEKRIGESEKHPISDNIPAPQETP